MAVREGRWKTFPANLVEAAKFRMEHQGLTRKDLDVMVGLGGRIAEVLDRTRSLSMAMKRRLHDRLGIPAEILIGLAKKRAA